VKENSAGLHPLEVIENGVSPQLPPAAVAEGAAGVAVPPGGGGIGILHVEDVKGSQAEAGGSCPLLQPCCPARHRPHGAPAAQLVGAGGDQLVRVSAFGTFPNRAFALAEGQ